VNLNTFLPTGLPDFTNPIALLSTSLLLLFALSASGMLLLRIWGIFAFYLLVLVATVFFSLPLVTFISMILPESIRPWAMIIVNISLLGLVITIHQKYYNLSKNFTKTKPFIASLFLLFLGIAFLSIEKIYYGTVATMESFKRVSSYL